MAKTHPNGRTSQCPCGTLLCFDRIDGVWWCENCQRRFADGTEPRTVADELAGTPRPPSLYKPGSLEAHSALIAELTSHMLE